MSGDPIQSQFKARLGPVGVSLLYAGFAALWIVASGLILSFTVDDPALQTTLEIGKGLLYVVVTSFLLYWLVRWSQARIQRLSRLYAALSQCNQAIVHSTSTDQLFPQICLDAVRFGGMRMAWIGMVDEASQTIRPVASYGEGSEYLEGIHIPTDAQNPAGRSPAAMVVSENKPFWCQDYQKDPMLGPWQARAKPFGWNSVAVLPLCLNKVPIGIFVVYFAERNAFDEPVRHLLVEMAYDISFALDNFEREAARLQAEKSLRESEIRYSTLFENNSVPMLLLDQDSGDIVDANATACQYYGWEREALRRMNIGKISTLPPADFQQALKYVREKGAGKFAFRHRLAGGEERDVEVYTGPVTIDGRNLRLSTIIDIRDRKQAEQDARSALAMTQHFLDHLPGLAYIKNSDLRVMMVNQGFRTLLGLEPATMVGKTNDELFPSAFAGKINADDRRILESGKTETVIETLGDRHYASTKFVIDDEKAGKLIAGVTLDITERQLLNARQQALIEINNLGTVLPEAEFLRRGVEIAERLTASDISLLYFVSDDQQTIEAAVKNENAKSVCCANSRNACPVSEARPWARCIVGKKAWVFNDYARTLGAETVHSGGTHIERLLSMPVVEDGLVRLVLLVGNKKADYNDEDTLSLQLIGNDLWRIARRIRVEAALKQQVQELKELNRKLEETQNQLIQSEKLAAIGMLAAGVAHEINNPVSFVQSNVNALSEYIGDLLQIDAAYREIEGGLADNIPQALERVKQIKQKTNYDFIVNDLRSLVDESRSGLARVSRIVQDLKNFARVGETDWQWVSLHDELDGTLNIVRSLINPDIEIRCTYGHLPLVHCIPAQINQVFLNLIINAAQSIVLKGEVNISTGCERDQVWVAIQDNGTGVLPENRRRLFEPFFTTKPVGQGTGLGLSLSQSIVQRHMGRIEVESESGRGSVFRVILPVDALAGKNSGKDAVGG
jgi:PAS domain S-box-containing protein